MSTTKTIKKLTKQLDKLDATMALVLKRLEKARASKVANDEKKEAIKQKKAAKKVVSKKPAAKKVVVRKSTAKKVVAKKVVAKKTVTKRVGAKKVAAKATAPTGSVPAAT